MNLPIFTAFPWAGCVLLVLAALAGPDRALAQRLLEATPADYRQYLTRLQPGDTLRLAPGVYRTGLPLRRLNGSAAAPIVITGPETGDPAVFLGRDGHITISLIDVSHLTLRHLTLDGQGARGHGLVAEGRGRFAHHITLEHLRISGYNAAQGFNGISTKTPAWNWIIRHNHLSETGTGMYLGDSDGGAPFIAGLIEGNRIENTLGYNLQIKHQIGRPELTGLPTDSQETIIRYNTFDKAIGGAEGGNARPNVLLGHWPLAGPGAEDRYRVYGNLFHQNPTERLFQAEGHVIAHHNLFVNHHGEAVSFQPHNHLPREIHFHLNTVVGRGPAVSLRGGDEGYGQQAVGNLIYSERPPFGVDGADNRLAPLAETPDEEFRTLAEPGSILFP